MTNSANDAFNKDKVALAPVVSKEALAVSGGQAMALVISLAIFLVALFGGGRQQQGPQKVMICAKILIFPLKMQPLVNPWK